MVEEPLLLEPLHGAPDRGGRDAQVVGHPDVLGTDRLRPHDVTLHHELEDPPVPLVEIGSEHGFGLVVGTRISQVLTGERYQPGPRGVNPENRMARGDGGNRA